MTAIWIVWMFIRSTMVIMVIIVLRGAIRAISSCITIGGDVCTSGVSGVWRRFASCEDALTIYLCFEKEKNFFAGCEILLIIQLTVVPIHCDRFPEGSDVFTGSFIQYANILHLKVLLPPPDILLPVLMNLPI